jgi:hypothetical protein
MELLKEVATISGKPGLYRILKPTRTGVIVESIDEKKQKLVINKTTRVSVLSDISVYTRISNTHMMPLNGIFRAMRNRFGAELPIDGKTATDTELAEFLVKFAPEYDRNRVHSSDIQKIISWYNILMKHWPEAVPTKSDKSAPVNAAQPTPEVPVVDMSAPQPEEPEAESASADPEPVAETTTMEAPPAEPATEEASKKKPRSRKKAATEQAKAA